MLTVLPSVCIAVKKQARSSARNVPLKQECTVLSVHTATTAANTVLNAEFVPHVRIFAQRVSFVSNVPLRTATIAPAVRNAVIRLSFARGAVKYAVNVPMHSAKAVICALNVFLSVRVAVPARNVP